MLIWTQEAERIDTVREVLEIIECLQERHGGAVMDDDAFERTRERECTGQGDTIKSDRESQWMVGAL